MRFFSGDFTRISFVIKIYDYMGFKRKNITFFMIFFSLRFGNSETRWGFSTKIDANEFIYCVLEIKMWSSDRKILFKHPNKFDSIFFSLKKTENKFFQQFSISNSKQWSFNVNLCSVFVFWSLKKNKTFDDD